MLLHVLYELVSAGVWSFVDIFSVSLAILIALPLVVFMVYFVCILKKRLDYVSLSGESLPHRAANTDTGSWQDTSLEVSTSTSCSTDQTDQDDVKFYLPSEEELSGHWTKQQYMPAIFKPPNRKTHYVIRMF